MAGYKHLEIPGNFERYVKDKKQSANAYYRYFLARLERMFEYKNLPDTIPHEVMDRYLFNNGIALITKVNDKLYCFFGNLGGPQDVYYRPTEFIVANPHLKSDDGQLFSANIPIYRAYQNPDEIPNSELGQPTGVLMRNDTELIGLAPLISRYSFLMAENILTLRTADVMLRITALLTAPSDKERASALEYLKNMENGILGLIGENPFFDGVKLQSPPSNNGSYLTQFIEYQQYLKGSFYNEIGLSANYNMKREAIGKGESTLDEDALLPLCDDMLLCRKQDLAQVNELFGTDIEVSFSSAWLENVIETKSTLVEMAGSTQNSFSPFGAEGGSGNAGFGQNDGSTQEGTDGEVEPEEPKNEPDEQVELVEPKEPEEPEEPDDEPDNPDSKLNDETWSEDLHNLEEQLDDKMKDDGSTQITLEGGVEDANSGNDGTDDEGTKSEDDEGNSSDG